MSRIAETYAFACAQANREDEMVADLIGATGFIQFAFAMEVAARKGDPRLVPAVNPSLLRNADVERFFRRWYHLPGPGETESSDLAASEDEGVSELVIKPLKHASPYRVGNTSFILVKVDVIHGGASYSNTVLKCLRPRFATFGSIEERTESYSSDYYAAETFAPQVFGSGARYVSMSRISGRTLDDKLADIVAGPTDEAQPLSQTRRDLARTVVAAASAALPELDKPHFDLSPWNIMLTDAGAVRFIDFGMSFILQGGYSSADAAGRARRFIAPELFEQSVDERWADIYSLGMILLDILTRPHPEPPERYQDDLDRLWRDAPGLAAVVEDLIEREPRMRALLTTQPPPPNGDRSLIPNPTLREVYESADRAVVREDEFYSDVVRRTGDGSFLPAGLLDVLHFTRDQFRRLGSVVEKYRRNRDPVVRQARILLDVARWCVGLGAVLVSVFWTATLLDLGASEWEGLGRRAAFFPIGREYLFSHFAMRLVPLSIGLVAVMYYLNIFATISTSELRDRASRRVEALIRACAIAPVLLQLVPLLFPRLWGSCALAGGSIVAANNRAVVKYAKRTRDRSEFSSLVLTSGFLSYFGKWAPSLLLYSGSTTVVWALWYFRPHWVHDVYIFAILILVGNLGKMYFQNCVGDAPDFRSNLARAISARRRIDALCGRERDAAAP